MENNTDNKSLNIKLNIGELNEEKRIVINIKPVFDPLENSIIFNQELIGDKDDLNSFIKSSPFSPCDFLVVEAKRTKTKLPQSLINSFMDKDNVYESFASSQKLMNVWLSDDHKALNLVFLITEGFIIPDNSRIEISTKNNRIYKKRLESSPHFDSKISVLSIPNIIDSISDIRSIKLSIDYRNKSLDVEKLKFEDINIIKSKK